MPDKLEFWKDKLMKIVCIVLNVMAFGFCVAGFLGHSAAWAAAAVSFFAGSMVVVGRRNKKDTEDETK